MVSPKDSSNQIEVQDEEHPELKCTCNDSEKVTAKALPSLEANPALVLPSFGIELERAKDCCTEYQEMFADLGIRVVLKDLSRCRPNELKTLIEIIRESEKTLSARTSFASEQKEIQTNENPLVKTPSSSASTDSSIQDIQNLKLSEQLCLLFKFHGKQMSIGRFRRNCPVELRNGSLVVLTIDDRYRYCSTKEIIFVTNLRHHLEKSIFPKQLIFIEGCDCVLVVEVFKVIDQHVTCCVRSGGKLRSYSQVAAQVC